MNFNDLKDKALTKSQMRNIKGGVKTGNCGYHNTTTDTVHCNISKEEALSGVKDGNGYWCCDSCGSSSYCG